MQTNLFNFKYLTEQPVSKVSHYIAKEIKTNRGQAFADDLPYLQFKKLRTAKMSYKEQI